MCDQWTRRAESFWLRVRACNNAKKQRKKHNFRFLIASPPFRGAQKMETWASYSSSWAPQQPVEAPPWVATSLVAGSGPSAPPPPPTQILNPPLLTESFMLTAFKVGCRVLMQQIAATPWSVVPGQEAPCVGSAGTGGTRFSRNHARFCCPPHPAALRPPPPSPPPTQIAMCPHEATLAHDWALCPYAHTGEGEEEKGGWYRESFGLPACAGRVFESPPRRRPLPSTSTQARK